MNPSPRATLLAALLLTLAGPLAAEVYTYTDEHGNRVFTDRPRDEASKSVEVRQPNRMSTPAPAAAAPVPAPPATRKLSPQRYERVWIVSPVADDTLRDNAGNLNVSAASEPPLRPGDRYRLLLDGKPAGEPGPTFTLSNIDRGTHQLLVEVVAPNGTVLGRSGSQAVHVKRISMAQRRMAQPCEKDDYGVRPECPLKDKPAEKRDIPFVPFF